MNVCAFTIIPLTWEVPQDQLDGINPKLLLLTFIAALYGNGAAGAKDWLIAFIHGECDPVAGVYRLHLHGLASDDMIEVVDRLRKLPNYATRRFLADGSPSPVYRRVRIERKPLTNLPAPITYLMQSFWPSRPVIINEDGRRVRSRVKQRIAEPYHSQVLLWLDKWGLDDLTVMIGLRVTKNGLKQTKRSS